MTTHDHHDPADTRMMGIVHSGLRRDLVRLRIVLESTTPSPQRRAAIADHMEWLVHFLHQHHAGEDDGLFPLVLRRNPAAADLLDTMDADHQRMQPALEAFEAAAGAYRSADDGAEEFVLAAVAAVSDVVLPHLAREEREMMPVVSASITDAEWRAWDQEFNIKPKGLMTLAVEAGWVLDGLDADSRRHVEQIVPAIPRFLLTRVLSGRYRAIRRRLWAGTPAEEVPSLALSDDEATSAA